MQSYQKRSENMVTRKFVNKNNVFGAKRQQKIVSKRRPFYSFSSFRAKWQKMSITVWLKCRFIYSFWRLFFMFFVWFYWISLSKRATKEICSFYETERNIERWITSLQSSSALFWYFLIPSCIWINQTRRDPLDIFSFFLEIWAAYNPVANIRTFIRVKSDSYM